MMTRIRLASHPGTSLISLWAMTIFFHGERYKWSVRLTAINIANNYVLYNFLSTFSGTHYVTPRDLTAQIGFHF
jgi:hypothetical protein